jgi:hypothetical protein
MNCFLDQLIVILYYLTLAEGNLTIMLPLVLYYCSMLNTYLWKSFFIYFQIEAHEILLLNYVTGLAAHRAIQMR